LSGIKKSLHFCTVIHNTSGFEFCIVDNGGAICIKIAPPAVSVAY